RLLDRRAVLDGEALRRRRAHLREQARLLGQRRVLAPARHLAQLLKRGDRLAGLSGDDGDEAAVAYHGFDAGQPSHFAVVELDQPRARARRAQHARVQHARHAQVLDVDGAAGEQVLHADALAGAAEDPVLVGALRARAAGDLLLEALAAEQ